MQFLTKRNFLHTARTTQNKNLSALLACVGTLLLPTSVLAGDLTQYQAKYDVLRKGETHGKAVRELKKAADDEEAKKQKVPVNSGTLDRGLEGFGPKVLLPPHDFGKDRHAHE